jgi:hypothetical protein
MLKEKTDIELMTMLVQMEQAYDQIRQSLAAVRDEMMRRVDDFKKQSNATIQQNNG